MESIEDWIEALKQSGKLVLVEGKKDKQALQLLGLEWIMMIAGKSTYKVVDEVEQKKVREVVILTDLDSEGRRLYARLKRAFERGGIKVDRKFREFLFSETKYSTIEGIKAPFGV